MTRDVLLNFLTIFRTVKSPCGRGAKFRTPYQVSVRPRRVLQFGTPNDDSWNAYLSEYLQLLHGSGILIAYHPRCFGFWVQTRLTGGSLFYQPSGRVMIPRESVIDTGSWHEVSALTRIFLTSLATFLSATADFL